MDLDAEFNALREQLLALGPRGPGKRYPLDLQRRVVAFTLSLRPQNHSQDLLAQSLGISPSTLTRWLDALRPDAEDEHAAPFFAPLHLRQPPAPHTHELLPGLELHTPSGLKLTGLSFEQALRVLQVLG